MSGGVKRKEFGLVNLVVSVSDEEVRVWACSEKGVSVFRLKVNGRVFKSSSLDNIIVISR